MEPGSVDPELWLRCPPAEAASAEVEAEVVVVTVVAGVIEAAADPGAEAETANVDDEALPGRPPGRTREEGLTRENETKNRQLHRDLWRKIHRQLFAPSFFCCSIKKQRNFIFAAL